MSIIPLQSKFAVCILALIFTPSCAPLLQSESVNLRQHAVDYNMAQIMDNLIRGSKGQLMLHVDVDTITTNVKANNSAGFAAGRTSAASGEITRLATSEMVVSKVASVITKPIGLSGGSTLEGSLNSQAKPSKDFLIYKSYLQFLNLRTGQDLADAPINYQVASGSSSLRTAKSESDIKEPYITGTVVKTDGLCYYIPQEFQQLFFQLTLAILGKLDPTGKAPVPTPGQKQVTLPGVEIPSPEKSSFKELLQDEIQDEIQRQAE